MGIEGRNDAPIAFQEFSLEEHGPFFKGDALKIVAAKTANIGRRRSPFVLGRDTVDEIEAAINHVRRRVHLQP